MRRRDVLAALAGIGLAPPGPAAAANSGRGCFEGADRLTRCNTGFPDLPAIPHEPCPHRAWAVCLAYLLRGYGATVETRDVEAWHFPVAPASAGAACRPSAPAMRLAASSGEWADQRGRRFLVATTPLPGFSEYRIRDPEFGRLLARLQRQPVLCGAAGHTTVVAEIQTAQDRFGRVWRERVRVLDPVAPGPGLRDLDDEELARESHVTAVSVRAL